MDHIAGLSTTGRTLIGPASDLVELEAENGLRHTAIVFHPEYRDHSAITDALGVVRGFLESPLVTGLVELVAHDPEMGAFVYPTGEVWSVAEIIRVLSDLGEPAGPRAGLELMYTAGQILVEGADAGSAAGVYSHSGVTPRRIMIKRDGQVMVIGHGLPQVEILQFHEVGQQLPREDSFRYCPPERLEAKPEDLSSDLFSLALVGFELMTGKPVYDGLVNDIRQKAARGEGSRRLFRFREVVDEPIRDVLTQMLRPKSESRFCDGDEFLDAIHGLLSQRRVEGLSLIELMDKVAGAGSRQGQRMESGRTVMANKDSFGLESEASEGDSVAEGRSADRAWSPGRRRTVRRGGGQSPVVRTSRTEDPETPPPTVVEVQESVDVPVAPVPSPEESPGSHRWSKVQRPVGRRRPARSRAASPEPPAPSAPPAPPAPAAPAAPPAPIVPDASGDGSDGFGRREAANADALLAQIRGVSEPPQVAPPDKPEPLAPIRTDESATVMMSRVQLRSAVADALDGAQRMTVLDTTQAEDGRPVVPTVSLDNAGSGKLQPFRIAPPGGGKDVEVQLPNSATAAEAVGWMVGSVVPLPLDMSGRLSGWYRLQHKSKPLPPETSMASIGKKDVLTLEFVPSESCSAQIEVVQGESTVRFMSPVGTAVPIGSIVAHLCSWMGLAAGNWYLCHDGKPLREHAILSDLGTKGTLKLILRRDDG